MRRIVQAGLLLLASSHYAAASLYGDEFIMPSCQQNQKSEI
jgi:hypothetical protein